MYNCLRTRPFEYQLIPISTYLIGGYGDQLVLERPCLRRVETIDMNINIHDVYGRN